MSRRNFLEFDRVTLELGKVRGKVWRTLRPLLQYFALSLFFTCLAYAVFALCFNTDNEKRLAKENRMYKENYGALLDRSDLLEDAVASLQHKDSDIYDLVFHSNAPASDPMSSLDFLFASDSIPDSRLYSYARDKADSLLNKAARVEEVFLDIFASAARPDSALPPMCLPLQDITYPQVGASMGRRVNPFYKTETFHNGLDFIVVGGTPVYAAADGVVGSGTGTSKTAGRVVEIEHEGGYVTRYAHLESVFVAKGQKVKCGQKIGTVGMTGKTYAPHLHYEVYKGDVCLDPVNCLFASVSPDEYANMLYMAVGTMQSMD